MWQRLRQAIQIRQISAALFGLVFGLLVEVSFTWLTGSESILIAVLFAILIALGVLNAWLWFRNPDRVTLRVDPPQTLSTQHERDQNAQRGLIAFVSLYRPRRDSTAPQDPQQWLEAAQSADYQTLDLANSNLAPVIEAVTSHAARLEHCWLIGTAGTGPHKPGSADYIPALREYLIRERGVECQFHCGPEYQVSLQEDAQVFTKTMKTVMDIYRQAETDKAIGLKSSEIISDFTSGIRTMPLGMILACLDSDHDMQMMGTHYDAEGQPTGELFPIVFGFQAIVRQS